MEMYLKPLLYSKAQNQSYLYTSPTLTIEKIPTESNDTKMPVTPIQKLCTYLKSTHTFFEQDEK